MSNNTQSILKVFSEKNVLDQETIGIKTMSKVKKDYYQNILTYLDEYIYFNYLKLTNPDFGFVISSMNTYYLKVDVSVSLPLILYYKRYPDDDEIDPFRFIIIEEELKKLRNQNN